MTNTSDQLRERPEPDPRSEKLTDGVFQRIRDKPWLKAWPELRIVEDGVKMSDSDQTEASAPTMCDVLLDRIAKVGAACPYPSTSRANNKLAEAFWCGVQQVKETINGLRDELCKLASAREQSHRERELEAVLSAMLRVWRLTSDLPMSADPDQQPPWKEREAVMKQAEQVLASARDPLFSYSMLAKLKQRDEELASARETVNPADKEQG